MNDPDEVTFEKVTYNATALLGWFGLAVGVVASFLQTLEPSIEGTALLSVGLIASSITVLRSGPVRRIETYRARLKPAPIPSCVEK